MSKNPLRFLAGLLLLTVPAMTAGMGTVTVEDIVAGYDTVATVSGAPTAAAIEVHVIGPSGDDTAIPAMTDARGGATVAVPARLMTEAGDYRVFGASGRSKVTGETVFTVLSQGIDDARSSVSVGNPLLTADGQSFSIVSVTLRDSLGMALPGRPVQIVGSRTNDRIVPLGSSRETDTAGRVQFAVQTLSPGEIVLRAMDLVSGKILKAVARVQAIDPSGMGGFGNIYTAQLTPDASGAPDAAPATMDQFASTPPAAAAVPASTPTPTSATSQGIVSAFVIETTTPTVKVRDVLPLVTIKAVDASGNVVTGFTGTVKVETPNDKNSTLPGYFDDGTAPAGMRTGKVTFIGKNRGVFPLAWSLSFSKAGQQPIVVTDETGTIRGEAIITVTGSTEIPADKRITVTSPKNGDTVKDLKIIVEGKGPKLSDLHVWAKPAGTPVEEMTSGDPAAIGDTGAEGTFSFAVTLPDVPEAMIQIQDSKAEYDSGVISVKLDRSGPPVSYAMDPATPRESEAVTVTVDSEPDLPSVTLSIDGKLYTLTEIDTGRYQVPILAPKSGQTPFTIQATDAAGNTTVKDAVMGVDGPALPQVQNVKLKSVAGGLEVSWDRIPDETVTSYLIDVGTSPNVMDFPLDTSAPTDSVAVMGLKAGIDYFLTVRAMRGVQKGPPSDIVSARTLGVELTVTGEKESLLLQWTFPDSTPLSQFILEYGPGEDFYSEKRVLDGGMRVFTVKNLLPQMYFVRLTPIASNGQTLDELAVTATGMPLAGTFHASADDGDTLGQRTADVPPSNELHEGAPSTTDSGLPPIPLWLVAAITVMAATWYLLRRKRRLHQTQAFLRRMHDTYRQ